MIKKGFVWIFMLFCLFGSVQATDRDRYVSPNNCPLPDGEFSAWNVIGVLPVGAKLENLRLLGNLLAPIETPNGPVYDKAWMKVAKREWRWTEDDFAAHYMDFEQGHFRLEPIPPCTVFVDQIYGGSKPPNPIPEDWYAPAPRNFGKLVLFDPLDHQPGLAWVSRVNNKHDAYYFQGCANPSIKPMTPVKIHVQRDMPIGRLEVTKTVRNVSRGDVEFVEEVEAKPGEQVEFRGILSILEHPVQKVRLRDALGVGLTIEGPAMVGGSTVPAEEFFRLGSMLGDISPQDWKEYRFTAVVASSFPIGYSRLENKAIAASDIADRYSEATAWVRVVVEPPPPPVPEIVYQDRPCPECNVCEMPEWKDRTTQDVAKYWPKSSKAKKVRLHELLDGQYGFWRTGDQQVVTELHDRIISELQKDKNLKWNSKTRQFNRKVQVAHINYDFCTKQYILDVYWEGWHWKEYFLGVLTGLPIGFVIGRATCPELVKVIEKAPFFNPVNRPMTFANTGLKGSPSAETGIFWDPRFDPPKGLRERSLRDSLLEILKERGNQELIGLW